MHGGLKPGFYRAGSILFFKKRGACVPMPIFRYFSVAGSALLAMLFVCDAYFGDASGSRFNESMFESATYAPRAEQVAAKTDRRFARDVSASDRVKEVFAQFGPNDARRSKRYSSIGTVIR